MHLKELFDIYENSDEMLDPDLRQKLNSLPSKTPITPELLESLGATDIPTIMGSQWWRIRGIGPALGAKLWSAGVRDLNEYIDKLPLQSQMWLKYDPISKIPHDDILKIAEEFMGEEKNWEIVGSWRRKKPFSGDIDILYWGPELGEKKWEIYAKGPQKIAGMFKTPKGYVEIDVWTTTPETLPFMRLYATGSKQWNIVMRRIAKKKGMKLNQYELTKAGKSIPAKSEEEIFEKLGIKYRRPEER